MALQRSFTMKKIKILAVFIILRCHSSFLFNVIWTTILISRISQGGSTIMKLKPESEKERYRLIKQNKNTKDKTLVT